MKPEITPEAWSSLLDQIASRHSDGSLIPHSWLKTQFGIVDPQIEDYENTDEFLKAAQLASFDYMALVDSLRWQLLEQHCYFIRNVKGSGYVIVNPKDQVEYGYEMFVESVKKLARETSNIMSHVRETTPEQQAYNNELRAKHSIVKQMVLSLKTRKKYF